MDTRPISAYSKQMLTRTHGSEDPMWDALCAELQVALEDPEIVKRPRKTWFWMRLLKRLGWL